MNNKYLPAGLVTKFIHRPWMQAVQSVGEVIGKIQNGLTVTWIVQTDICLVPVRFDGSTPVIERPQPITGVGGGKPKSGRLQADIDAIVTALTQAGYTPRLAA